VSKPSSGLLKMQNRKSKKKQKENQSMMTENANRKFKRDICTVEQCNFHSSAFANIGFMDQIKD